MLILLNVASQWGRSVIASMNGFGVIGLRDKPYYNMTLDLDNYTRNAYAIIVGPAYNIIFAICLLFTG